jgi:hypothetical protein
LDRRNRPHPKVAGGPASQDEDIVPPIVTKSGQIEMDFLTVWQASREIVVCCLNVRILDTLSGLGPALSVAVTDDIIATATPRRGEIAPMGRVAIVAGCWYLLWIAIVAVYAGLTSGPSREIAHALYFGLLHGAWLALVTSFAWPWILPDRIDRWMDR